MLAEPTDIAARGAMLLGAHLAGIAIEQSMLGATHACASALTAHCGIGHGVAIAVMLPHVVRWNAGHVGDRYSELLRLAGRDPGDAPGARLASRLEELARAAGLPASLGEIRVPRKDFLTLAAAAARQRTGTFNPRPFDAPAALARLMQAPYQQRGLAHLARAFDQHDAVAPRDGGLKFRIRPPLDIKARSQRHRATQTQGAGQHLRLPSSHLRRCTVFSSGRLVEPDGVAG